MDSFRFVRFAGGIPTYSWTNYSNNLQRKKMREIINQQMQLGEVDISKIEFDPRSRDDIPKLLKGLQHIYCTPKLKEKVF